MKHFFRCLVLLSLSTFAFSQSLDGIAAYVNSNVITQSEVKQSVNALTQQLQSSHQTLPSAAALHQQVLNQLIDEQLQLQAAKQSNLKIDDKKVDLAIANIAKQNKVNVAQLKTAVEQTGLSFLDYREHIKKQMLIAEVQQAAVGHTITLTPADVAEAKKSLTNEQALYHIVAVQIPVDEGANEQTWQQAKTIADSLVSKVKQTSDAPVAADFQLPANEPAVVVNDLGIEPLSNLPNLFAATVSKMKTGDVSAPIKAPNGYHILKCVAEQGGGDNTEQAKQVAYGKKLNVAAEKWLKTLRATAYIKVVG